MREQHDITRDLVYIEQGISDIKNPQRFYDGQMNFIRTMSGSAYDASVTGDFTFGKFIDGVVTFTNDSGIVPFATIHVIPVDISGNPLSITSVYEISSYRYQALYTQGGGITWLFRFRKSPSAGVSTVYFKYFVISNDSGSVTSSTWSVS